MLESRTEAREINPLIGKSTTDTIDNLCQCLDSLGTSFAREHGDDAISFFCSSVAAALRFEAGQMSGQGGSVRTIPPIRLASSSG